MNGPIHHIFLMNRLIKWPLLFGLSGFLLAQTVPAGQDFYINNSVVTNPGNIDATNFINNNSFSSGTFFSYETTDTLNYTNNGTMTGSGGFLFDTLTSGVRSMASSFYNPGSISGGKIVITATNLASPGLLDEGANGGLFLTGQNVDLSYATLTMDALTVFNPPGTGNFGTDTNGDWDPSVALTAIGAFSSLPNAFFIPSVPTDSYLASYQLDVNPVTTNNIYRAIFLGNDPTANVSAQALFGQIAIGTGAGNVVWQGVYVDPATGLQKTNYLILNNDYVLGASTNITFNNGIPDNFAFSTDPTTVTGANPGTVGIPPFTSGAITNPYSYALVQIVPTSVATGPTASNPSGAITNLPARIQISASKELNLALSTIRGQFNVNGQIAGLNYLSLTCTNQFDGASGATIIAPYSDINLGVTNGYLTISNVLQSVIPNWSGTIQAWSTEFFTTTTNTGPTITNDFRVLIVSSSLVPFSTPQIQNLTLHGTNLVISDVLNVMNNLSIDAQSLTLTTNSGYPNNKAGSPEGELNLESGATLFATGLPNLLWLTNNGAITIANAGNFGAPSPANYKAFINNGLLLDSGSTIYSTYFQNSGTIANGSGNFFLQSQSVVLTNGSITATGDIAITSGSLVAGKVSVQAGRSLTLQVTNLLTDDGATNVWFVGASSLNGLNLPILPAAGDLQGTTISVFASKNVVNTWAGADRGVSTLGYLNNASVGSLILNATNVPPHSLFTFNPATGTNAMYVVNLYLTNTAATFNFTSSNATALAISPNMVIYYQQAYSNGVPVSAAINGWNNNRLRWVSSNSIPTNIVVQAPAVLPGGFQFTISGAQLPSGVVVTGASYNVVIQSATNLVSPNWVNVYTGTPPFNFTSSGYTNGPEQFYRAKQGW